MSTIYISRAIRALLGELMGTFAEGSLFVRSTGGTVLLPAGSFAVPLHRGAFCDDGTVFVTENPGRPDGAWEVTDSGTSIPVVAMLGAALGNADAGIEFRWFPTIEGIEEVSQSEGIEGGEAFDSLAAPRQLIAYKSLGSEVDQQSFFQAQMGEFPALCLAWESTKPMDGPITASPGPRAGRMGQSAMKMRHSWILYVVTTRYEGEAVRRMEGDAVRDEVLAQLFGREGTRGLRTAASPGITINDASVTKVTSTSYIDVIRFETPFVMEQRIADEAKAKPWLKTRIVRTVPVETDNTTQVEKLIPDVTVPMT